MLLFCEEMACFDPAAAVTPFCVGFRRLHCSSDARKSRRAGRKGGVKKTRCHWTTAQKRGSTQALMGGPLLHYIRELVAPPTASAHAQSHRHLHSSSERRPPAFTVGVSFLQCSTFSCPNMH